ncbi:DNA-directed RNA polymerase subunit beta [Candidatus Gromoviella agglomerans]|uniref:DNA-directed RNA polymerase subunit beta n=1 Tax=Candidatus Gromoviella agglomerans TaxID=2806609 RepID=UPI001E2F1864|nr:DNA-directed RNA polymerase subunit beta [Candidatus Gromoviella agglomerans]UFX98550.1 DNA-directed RNA polymerase subunit beta [Candidatus Gromoviella agglomerans]
MKIGFCNDRPVRGRCVTRRSFSRLPIVFPDNSLLSVQEESYFRFMGSNEFEGDLSLSLRRFFPLYNSSKSLQLRYLHYRFGIHRFSPEECIKRELTYSVPIFATFEIVYKNEGEEFVRPEEIYMGEMPCMVRNGSFIVNGVERVIVSQIHRSPGVIFGSDGLKDRHSSYYAKIIPYRGSWIDFEDAKSMIFARIDKKRKVLASTFLLSLNDLLKRSHLLSLNLPAESCDFLSSNHDSDSAIELDKFKLLAFFYGVKKISRVGDNWLVNSDFSTFEGCIMSNDFVNLQTGNVLFKKGRVVDSLSIEYASRDSSSVEIDESFLINSYLVSDVFDMATGECIAKAGDMISSDMLSVFRDTNVGSLTIIFSCEVNKSPHMMNTILADKNVLPVDAICDVYRAIRPGDTPSFDGARSFFYGLFFDSMRYDLTSVGRAKLNERLCLNVDDDVHVLTPACLIKVVKMLINVIAGNENIDDVDSLLCRRVRSVGELFLNQCVLSFGRVERSMVDALNASDPSTVMPSDLVSVKFLDIPLRDCLLLSQLSQFMDQTNPLSEVSHKRRLSALGHGAISRDRSAGIEARDVHYTQYGKICPAETPEGPNLGLVVSLAMFANVDKHGFLRTPYHPVVSGVVDRNCVHLTAGQESGHKIAQATDLLNDREKKTEVVVRSGPDYVLVSADEVTLCDVSSVQGFSVATSLIPFVEKDDAHRALMGANMQRQAVPLLNPQEALIGTGYEAYVARESGAVVRANFDGYVVKVDGSVIVVNRSDFSGVDVYYLRKFQKSNAGTCVNQKPFVSVGDFVKSGQVISTGPAINAGELALGRDLLVAFVSLHGMNFEDAIVVSDKVADAFTSCHLSQYECKVSNSKGVEEEFTRNVPNVASGKLVHLNEFGLARVGSVVNTGDILAGKVSRNVMGYRSLPEERLLKALFGDVAHDVKDLSLRVPPGVRNATVVNVEYFVKGGQEKDSSVLFMERKRLDELEKKFKDDCTFFVFGLRHFFRTLIEKGYDLYVNKVKLTESLLNEMVDLKKFFLISSTNKLHKKEIDSVVDLYKKEFVALENKYDEDRSGILRGDDLPSGSIKVRFTLMTKRRLMVGDKMAGRHGNKGVVACILPVEDMPYLSDGTPIDIAVTPTGVPSRMNIGQIVETVFGGLLLKVGEVIRQFLCEISVQEVFDCSKLREFLLKLYSCDVIRDGCFVRGFSVDGMTDDEVILFATGLSRGMHIASPIFDGVSNEDIKQLANVLGVDASGEHELFDGRIGEKFDRPVTVGVMHYLKLHHLVEDKIHARSVGGYSLVTQQPLGGKAQFGGQRLGEMEVWALEGYGAAYILREMLTDKSDSVEGRGRIYSGIIEGQHSHKAGSSTSAAFQVLCKELEALCIYPHLHSADDAYSMKFMNDSSRYSCKFFDSKSSDEGHISDSEKVFDVSDVISDESDETAVARDFGSTTDDE